MKSLKNLTFTVLFCVAISFLMAEIRFVYSQEIVDCNDNNISDSEDILNGLSQDCDADNIPDECQEFSFHFTLPKIISDSGPVTQVELGDFDNDGIDEIVTLNPTNSRIQIWSVDSDNNLSLFKRLSAVPDARFVKLIDVDQDGLLDVITSGSNFSKDIIYHKSLGEGDFQGSILLSDFNGVRELTTLDLNQDGWNDLLYTSGNGRARYRFSNQADGFESRYTEFSVTGAVYGLSALDIDSDGIEEMFLETEDELVIANLTAEEEVQEKFRLEKAPGPTFLSHGDVNQDNLKDLIFTNWKESEIWIYYRTAEGSFSEADKISMAHHEDLYASLVFDFDRDGLLDLVATSSQFKISYQKGMGDGTFGSPLFLPYQSRVRLFPYPAQRDGDEPLLLLGGSYRTSGGFFATCRFEHIQKNLIDCNENGVSDLCEINEFPDLDQNKDGLLDACAPHSESIRDCNNNDVDDREEILEDPTLDCNKNLALDSCEKEEQDLQVGPRTTISLPSEVERLWVAQIDDNPIEDLIYLNADENILWVAKNQSQEFTSWVQFENPIKILTVCDLNDDSVKEVVILDSEGMLISYFNDGTGTLTQGGSIQVNSGADVLIPEDYNDDGVPEILIAYNRGFSVNPSRVGKIIEVYQFSLGETQELPLGITVRGRVKQILAGDLNNDSKTDLVINGSLTWDGEHGYIYSQKVYLSDPEESFVFDSEISVGQPLLDIQPRDINSDGNLDLFAFSSDLGVFSLLGNGDGTFKTSPLSHVKSPSQHFEFTPTIVRDLNGDGDLDLLGHSTQGISAFYGDGSGLFNRWQHFHSIHPNTNIALFDWTKDEHHDLLVVGPRSDQLTYYQGDELHTFSSSPVFEPPYFGYNYDRWAFYIPDDVNQHIQLMLLRYSTRAVDHFHFEGSSTIKTTIEASFPSASRIISRDLNSDDFPDLILSLTNNEEVWVSDGEGQLSLRGTLPEMEDSLFVLKDFNSDDYLDVAIMDDSQNNVSVFLNDGTGHFERHSGFATYQGCTGLFSDDFNHDGHLDLGFIAENQDLIHIQFGDGNGVFFPITEHSPQSPAEYDLSEPQKQIFTHDINGDGIKDLTWSPRTSNKVIRLLGRGDGTFNPLPLLELPISGSSFYLTHLDSDPYFDIVMMSSDPRNIHFLKGLGEGRFHDPEIIGQLSERSQLHILDIDRDGSNDLIGIDTSDRNHSSIVYVLKNHNIPFAVDCDENGQIDSCEIDSNLDLDTDSNGVLDECQEDCNQNEIPDSFEIAVDANLDCNGNYIIDSCEILAGGVDDVNENGIPDSCEPDCNGNEIPDSYEIQLNSELDCDQSGILDSCELSDNHRLDRNKNSVLDRCEDDCDQDGVPDFIAIVDGHDTDCDENEIPDSCQIATEGRSVDVNNDMILDSCQSDCDENGIPDVFQIEEGLSPDLDGNGILDSCEGGNQILGDCTGDQVLDISDGICIFSHLFLGSPSMLPCDVDENLSDGSLSLLDWQGDGVLDLSDGINLLTYQFIGGDPHHLAPFPVDPTACVRILGCPNRAICD